VNLLQVSLTFRQVELATWVEDSFPSLDVDSSELLETHPCPRDLAAFLSRGESKEPSCVTDLPKLPTQGMGDGVVAVGSSRYRYCPTFDR
jgi:hypothetical protein